MAYKIRNTALDHSRHLAQRKASRLQMEPVIAGHRLRLRSHLVLTDKVFEHNKPNLELYKKWGVLDWEHLGTGAKHVEETKEDSEPKLPPAPPVEPAPAPPVETAPPPAPAPAEVVAEKEAPPAEASPAPAAGAEPQPKSPFKGKKKQS